MTLARMYDELAPWWPLLSAPDEYVEEAGAYARILLESGQPPPRSLLELGSGGGNNASHLKRSFDMTLVDLAPGMLEVSRLLNPECVHMLGDMRSIRLGRQFDAVFIHDAIAYMTTEGDLERAMETAFVHCRAGGVALFAPDFTTENFSPGSDHGGHDSPERSMRFLEWCWDPDPSDTTYVADYVFALREGTGPVTVVTDRHQEGVFPGATWLRLLEAVGFVPDRQAFRHSEVEYDLELFLGRRPL